VVSSRDGVVQYDLGKETSEGTIHRHAPRPPGAALLESVAHLQAAELTGDRQWERQIDSAGRELHVARPADETDVLGRSDDPSAPVPHPTDPLRRPGQPRVFVGPIAAANRLLKHPLQRDRLRDRFKVKAVAMEGSGIADATWSHQVGYLVVRGICDYCDANKGDEWQAYAAVAAAAYARALLEATTAGTPSHLGYRGARLPYDDWWFRFTRVAAQLYPLGPTHDGLWVRAGGDLAALNLGSSGHANWHAAMNRLRLGGGGGITPARLLQTMREEYRGNPELESLAAAPGPG
jgi:nucleoside phosphorylase